MDEDRVRYPVGRTADGTTHRVGLTRHCLASGTIQLPFALRDTLPEGELLAHDVQRQEAVRLVCEPPRRLHGLRDLFQAHDLQVNDLLEIRLEDGHVRLATVQRARRVAQGREAARPPRRDPSARSARAAWRRREAGHSEEAAADDSDAGVVERFGSVTVRRLGAETARPPSGTTLPDEREQRPDAAADATPDATPEEAPSAPPSPPVDDAPSVQPPAESRAEEAAPAGEVQGRTSRVPEHPGPPHDVDVGDAPTDGVVPPMKQGDLFARPTGAQEGAVPARRENESRRSDTPHVAHASAASAPSALDDAPVRASDLADPDDEVKRRREESLSRAGDLRSRVVRWLLDPDTPVIVQHQHVQHAFDLPHEVARDLLAGVIAEPPPSLRLTELREGIFRVSRITVEHEA